jgi:RNA recognition motif-containing protein
MSNTEQRSGRSGYRDRGRRRNNNRGGRYRGNREGGQDGSRNQKKTNPIVAFFGKLFGFGKKQSGGKPSGERRERDRDRGERAPRAERPERSEAPQQETLKPEVETPRLYIGNLSYETSESDLFDLFSQVGTVNNVEIVRDGRSNSKGFGFVEMGELETAKAASEKFHRTDFMGRQIVVAGAKK